MSDLATLRDKFPGYRDELFAAYKEARKRLLFWHHEVYYGAGDAAALAALAVWRKRATGYRRRYYEVKRLIDMAATDAEIVSFPRRVTTKTMKIEGSVS